MNLHFTATTGRSHLPYLRRHLIRAAPLLPKNALAEVSIALVGDTTMSRLHLQFMNLPGPTDVLTFPLDTDARGRILSGEIVVCVPHARRLAPTDRISRPSLPACTVAQELLLYTLHGILHLCGLDDRTNRQFNRMHRLEDDILRQLGVGAVFDRHRNGSLPLGKGC